MCVWCAHLRLSAACSPIVKQSRMQTEVEPRDRDRRHIMIALDDTESRYCTTVTAVTARCLRYAPIAHSLL